MKKLVLSFVLCIAYYFNMAQLINQASVKLSFNQLEVDFQRKINATPFWGEVYLGLGNMDINRSLDDFLAGIRIGTVFFEKQKNVFFTY